MQIRVLYFARLRELARTNEHSLEVPPDSTVEDAVARLTKENPDLAGAIASCRTALDEEFVSADTPLRDGAVLALIPPVSGG